MDLGKLPWGGGGEEAGKKAVWSWRTSIRSYPSFVIKSKKGTEIGGFKFWRQEYRVRLK